ncbi:hypothetical protein B7494_g615 [Chlorociboria aeruginascens]|nr:hypothetical protein B7494_g615 [Chlorociboria aeruginascens]
MPTYLVHGFRWHRASIRIHIIIHKLDDAAAEWIIAPASAITILNSFYSMFDFLPPSSPPNPEPPSAPPSIPDRHESPPLPPATSPKVLVKKKGSMMSLRNRIRSQNLGINTALSRGDSNGRSPSTVDSGPQTSRPHSISTKPTSIMSKPEKKKIKFNDWSSVKLLEQYDPADELAVSQPWAYVADYIIPVDLGVSVTEEMSKYESKLKEEGSMSPPSTPGSSAISGTSSGADQLSPGMSARDIRRKSKRLGWFEKLRDGLQGGEEIGWYVVVCGDEDRLSPELTAELVDSDTCESPKSRGFRDLFRKKNVVEE